MIKLFEFGENDDIERIINNWERDNKFKIDSISISPYKWYMNNDNSRVTDMKVMVIINYHKRRIRKKIENSDNTSNSNK